MVSGEREILGKKGGFLIWRGFEGWYNSGLRRTFVREVSLLVVCICSSVIGG